MARMSTLAILLICLLAVSVEGRKNVRNLAAKKAAKTTQLAKCRTTLSACGTAPISVTVTTADQLYNATSTSAYQSQLTTVTIATSATLLLTRGLSINSDTSVVCGAGFTCTIDISSIGYTYAFIIHGGAHVNFTDIIFTGEGLTRTNPTSYVTGQNTVAYFISCIFSNIVGSYGIPTIVEIDRNAQAIFAPTVLTYNLTGTDITVDQNVGSETPSVYVCYPNSTITISSNAASIDVCYDSVANTPVIYTNGTSSEQATLTTNPSNCPSYSTSSASYKDSSTTVTAPTPCTL